MKNFKHVLIASLLIISNYTFAQSTGIIKGTVEDERGTSILFSPVVLMEGDKIIGGANTDVNGAFAIKDITPGKYNLRISSVGYSVKLIRDIEVDPSQIAYLTIKLKVSIDTLKEIVIEERFEKKIINPRYSTVTSINSEQIEQTPTDKGDVIALAIALTPAVQATPDGRELLMRGTRSGASGYIVDGFRTMDVPNVPGMGIASMEILTGGIPAEYGDVTGGIVIITTKDYKWEAAKSRIKKQNKLDSGK